MLVESVFVFEYWAFVGKYMDWNVYNFWGLELGKMCNVFFIKMLMFDIIYFSECINWFELFLFLLKGGIFVNLLKCF